MHSGLQDIQNVYVRSESAYSDFQLRINSHSGNSAGFYYLTGHLAHFSIKSYPFFMETFWRSTESVLHFVFCNKTI